MYFQEKLTFWIAWTCFVVLTFEPAVEAGPRQGGLVTGGRYLHPLPPNFHEPSGPMTQCGRAANGTHGHITTPNFPRSFPAPISCQWTFHAPPGKKIVLYFTQFYMRESFQLTEYDSYTDERTYRGRHELGTVSFEDEITSFSVYKPWLVLKFQVREIGNIHLRVGDFLLDVYGFNITYEIVDEAEPVRQDACSVYSCSFLGNCVASKNYETYACHCFKGYFGNECQYGPYCNPPQGVNMCKNGGKCRYFYGSLVNTCECPPSYYGVQCEKRRKGTDDSQYCELLGCSQKCEKFNNTYRCVCDEEFRLDSDNVTCVEKSRTRYYAQVRCSPTLNNDYQTMLEKCPNFTTEMLQGIQSSLRPRVIELHNLTSISSAIQDGYLYSEFYFMGEKRDKQLVTHLLGMYLERNEICHCHFDSSYFKFDAQPALHSMKLFNHEDKPVIEGRLLTLACLAKGSGKMTFRWFKDEANVSVHKTSRNMWETRINNTEGESQMSILNIDKADVLDEGQFTCSVQDWNETREKSLDVTVIMRPHVQVLPLSASVKTGAAILCTCLSRDDKTGDFVYTWWRDGELLQTGVNEEVVEDLYPTGSRVRIRSAHTSAVYSCEVESPAGKSREECHLSVSPDSTSGGYCEGEVYLGIHWRSTLQGGVDVRPCSAESTGKAFRKCDCVNFCYWSQPNLAQCNSLPLQQLNTRMESIELGYEVVTMEEIFQGLVDFYREQDTARPLIGDFQLGTEILCRLQAHSNRYSTRGVPSIQKMVAIISTILNRAKKLSQTEREESLVGEHILQLLSGFLNDNRLKLQVETGANQFSTSLPIVLTVHAVDPYFKNRQVFVSNKAVEVSLMKNLSFYRIVKRDVAIQDDPQQIVMTAISSGLSLLLPNDSLQKQHWHLRSDIISVGSYTDGFKISQFSTVRIVFQHQTSEIFLRSNLSRCAYWQSGERSKGWQTDRCKVKEVTSTGVTCDCLLPGHFALVSLENDHDAIPVKPNDSLVIIIGCCVSLACYFVTTVIYCLWWSHVRKWSRVTILSFCCVWMVLNSVIISTFTGTVSWISCQILIILSSFLFMAAVTLHLAQAVEYYYVCMSNVTTWSTFKQCLVSWGIPFLLCCSAFITVVVDKPTVIVGKYCWIGSYDWLLYTFGALCLILILVYIFLIIFIVLEMRKFPPTDIKEQKSETLCFLFQSIVLLSLVVFICAMSVAITQFDSLIFKICFAVTIIIKGLFVLVYHGFFQLLKKSAVSIGMCSIFLPCKDQNNEKIPSSNASFKSFVRQDSANDCKPKDGKGGNQNTNDNGKLDGNYPELQRKIRYTKEKKEQLKALLGTSRQNSYVDEPVIVTTYSTVRPSNDSAGTDISEGTTSQSQLIKPSTSGGNGMVDYPYKPARCKSYIVETGIDAPLVQSPCAETQNETDVSNVKSNDAKGTKKAVKK